MRHTPGAYAVGPYLLHQRVYRLTNGAIGRHVGGRPALMLHTVGRKTGMPRTTSLAGRYDVYQRNTDREIPVLVLTPDADDSSGGDPSSPSGGGRAGPLPGPAAG